MRGFGLVLVSIGPLLLGASADAATPFDAVASSSDTTVDLSGTLANDEDVTDDDLNAVVALIGPPGIPAGSDLTGYHQLASDDLFSLDTSVQLPGGLTVGPADVVRWDGVGYTLEFDGATNGIPGGARIDAISVDDSSGDLVLSFDVDVDLAGLVVADEDLVAFDGIGFSSFFDGSAAGLSASVDLDAVHAIGAGVHALSLDTSGEVGGVQFDDEDVLEYAAGSGSWELVFDASAEHSEWAAGDLDGLHLVPEPDLIPSLAVGLTFLVALHHRRSSHA